MEFYQVFTSFLAILKQSIKIFLRNWKSSVSITVLSQFLISISILLFSRIFKSLNSYMNDAYMEPYTGPTTTTSFDSSQSNALKTWLIYFVLLLVVQIAFVFVLVVIYKFSSVATILISAVSCGENTLSLQDLISRIIKTWKRLQQVAGWDVSASFKLGKQYWIFVGVLGIIPWLLKPNLITLLVAIFVGVIALIFHMYFSVDLILASVVCVVEESCKGQEALEKSQQLIEGHKIQGFLLNILFNLLALIICILGYWMIVGDNWILNLTVFVLFLVNVVSLADIFALVAYTVLYSECKKRCGEEIEILGIMDYTKLPNDIH